MYKRCKAYSLSIRPPSEYLLPKRSRTVTFAVASKELCQPQTGRVLRWILIHHNRAQRIVALHGLLYALQVGRPFVIKQTNKIPNRSTKDPDFPSSHRQNASAMAGNFSDRGSGRNAAMVKSLQSDPTRLFDSKMKPDAYPSCFNPEDKAALPR